MTHEGADPYAVLGVPRGASLLEIARARRRLAKQFHPDLAADGSGKRMQAINEAWQTLSDQHRRARGGLAKAVWEWPPPSGQPDWHGARAATVAPRSDEPSSGRTGWIVLAGMMLLMVLILVAGLVAAADGPAQPAPWAPGQYNLDTP